MNRKEAEDYIYHSYLKAQKYRRYITPDAINRHPELSRDIIRNLSSPPAIVITGSKGKGSVAKMISLTLKSKHRVGLFTSPHISDFRERICVDDEMISETDFIRNIEKIKPLFDKIDSNLESGKYISPIGIQTALAINYFKECNTSFNVLECGKGAKYDDVNNVIHQYSVINTIFLEHTRELGKTLQEIAFDKSHVITSDTSTVFIGPQEECVFEILNNRAVQLGVKLKKYGSDFYACNIKFTKEGMLFDVVIENETYQNILIPLLGKHQAKNCALALGVCKEIMGELDMDRIKKSLSALTWRGRMEILSSDPFIMLDATINAKSTSYVKESLDYLKIHNATLIVGIPDDKDFKGVVESMAGHVSKIILTKSQNPHYIFTKTQQDILRGQGIESVWSNNIAKAIEIAKNDCNPIIILGTTSLVAEVLAIFQTYH